MNHKERIDKIKRERRAQILHAGEILFARRGFGSTKVGDISKKAGVSHGLLYQYFDSKEEIFKEIVKNTFLELQGIIQVVESLNLPPMEKIKKIVDIALEDTKRVIDAGEYPYKFLIMIQAISLESSKEVIGSDPIINPLSSYLENLIIRGQKEGVIIKDDPGVLAQTLLSTLLGVAISSVPSYVKTPLVKSETILRLLKESRSE